MLDGRAMEAALAEMDAALVPNASAISKKYGLERTMLKKRFLGQTTSRATDFSERRQCLTTVQEDQLVNQINRLIGQGMPPTSQKVKNFAEEIIGRPVGKT